MSVYRTYTAEQTEELLSNYLVDSWSYSMVSAFSRNEKAFEKVYVYGEAGKRSASSVAGQAYHHALCLYFEGVKQGQPADIADMERAAFAYIDGVGADVWKIQKTTPTVAACIQKATETVSKLLANFMAGIETYTSEIAEVLHAEVKINEWVTVNGVDIPLPLHMVADLVIRTPGGKLVIIDHKSRSAFTGEADIPFTTARQAITYTLGYEAATGERVDEVWFIENKISKNKDGSPQLSCFKTVMDGDTRRLYGAILYEPLRRMIQAVSDPDYVYLVNDDDTFSDRAELYSFWAKTMIAEVEDFRVAESKKPLVSQRMKKIRDASLASITPQTLKRFRNYTEQFIPYDLTNKDMTPQEKIEHTLRSFGIVARIQHTFEGYSSRSYLLEVSAGTSVASVKKYALDLANALNVSSVRIQKDLFVYGDKSYLAIETGKKATETLPRDKARLSGRKIPLGLDNFSQTVYWDMDNQSTPHMLVCGATGSGKSVCIRSIVEYAREADVRDIFLFDPKYEFEAYRSRQGVEVINDIGDIEARMELLVSEMERRVKAGDNSNMTMIIFDEFADAVANARKGAQLKIYQTVQVGVYQNGSPKAKRVCVGERKSLEENLRILLQKGRSSGFRIVAATQRASTKVITGDAKVNFPVQVCFRVPKDIDSIVVLDEPGAESLNGRGDGLIKSPEYPGVVRFQAFYCP
jgi:autonomous glycyl radical cofactor GrcA